MSTKKEERTIDRLKKFADYIRKKGITKGSVSFEAYCGLSNQYIKNSARTGANGGIGSDIIARICKKFPELNVRWLCTGEGEMIDEICGAGAFYKNAYLGAMQQIDALRRIIETMERQKVGKTENPQSQKTEKSKNSENRQNSKIQKIEKS